MFHLPWLLLGDIEKTLKTSILNKTFETKVVANVNLHPSSKFCISIFVCLGAVNILHIFLQFKVLLRFWKKCKTKMFHNPFSCWSDNHCGMTFQKYEFHSDGMSIDWLRGVTNLAPVFKLAYEDDLKIKNTWSKYCRKRQNTYLVKDNSVWHYYYLSKTKINIRRLLNNDV